MILNGSYLLICSPLYLCPSGTESLDALSAVREDKKSPASCLARPDVVSTGYV